MDVDGGGAIRFDEFCAWCARKVVATESTAETESPKPTAESTVETESSDDEDLLIRRPRGKSWGGNRQGQPKRPQLQVPELGQTDEQPASILRRPRGKSWGSPRQEQEPQQVRHQEQHAGIIRRPRGTSWGAPRQEQEQNQPNSSRTSMQMSAISPVAELDSSDDSDANAADGQSTPDFASVADDTVSTVAEFEERWRAMGGSDRVLTQIRQNLRGASYNKGGQDPRKLFQTYDKDNSGEIDRWEFRQAVRKGGRVTPAMLNDADLNRLFDCVDVDGGGDLSIDELIMMIWGDDRGKKKDGEPEAEGFAGFRSQAKRMTEDARFEALREYYLDDRITAQRAAPAMKAIRSALEKNDFTVLCGKLQAKYGIHPLEIYNERCVDCGCLHLISASARPVLQTGSLAGLDAHGVCHSPLLLQACCFGTDALRTQRKGPPISAGGVRWTGSEPIAVVLAGQVTVARGR